MNVESVRRQLEAIQDADPEGLLRPEAVVKAAKGANHPLHSHFEWDDKKAGAKYRLSQARQLIVRVKVISEATAPAAPVFVSLINDRSKTGGGYRQTATVLKNADLIEQLRTTALIELRGWVRRHRMLNELTGAVAAAAGLELPEAE